VGVTIARHANGEVLPLIEHHQRFHALEYAMLTTEYRLLMEEPGTIRHGRLTRRLRDLRRCQVELRPGEESSQAERRARP
jgi:hypothetical protein